MGGSLILVLDTVSEYRVTLAALSASLMDLGMFACSLVSAVLITDGQNYEIKTQVVINQKYLWKMGIKSIKDSKYTKINKRASACVTLVVYRYFACIHSEIIASICVGV